MNRTKSKLASIVLASSFAYQTGCIAVTKLPKIDVEQCSTKYKDSRTRIGIEPLDTPNEVAYNTQIRPDRVLPRGVLPVYVEIENISDIEITLHPNQSYLEDPTKNIWEAISPQNFVHHVEFKGKENIGRQALSIICFMMSPLGAGVGSLIAETNIKRVCDNNEKKILYRDITLPPSEEARGLLIFQRKGLTGAFDYQGSKIFVPYSIKDERFEAAISVGPKAENPYALRGE